MRTADTFSALVGETCSICSRSINYTHVACKNFQNGAAVAFGLMGMAIAIKEGEWHRIYGFINDLYAEELARMRAHRAGGE